MSLFEWIRMVMKNIVLLSMLSLVLFTGCRVVGGGVRVNIDHPHGHVVPPVHAPAHGVRRHHMYHYYPNAEFYFDVGRNMYFYLDSRAQWAFSVNLPVHLHRHLNSGYVEIEMEDERPYLRHRDHKKKYNKRSNKYKRYDKKEKNNNYKKNKRHRDDEEDDRRGRGR